MANINNEDILDFVGEPFADLTFSHIDSKHSIFSSESFLFDHFIVDHSNTIDFNTTATTPNGSMPSHSISLSSPPQLVLGLENPLLNDLGSTFSSESLEYSNTTTDLFVNISDTRLSKDELDGLEIIVQPNATYRARYESEVDKGKGRANRYIRTAKDNQYEYPTVKIPSWCHPNQRLYIRVTLVTITNDKVLDHYIHPYTIRTSDQNAIRDPVNNSLYFRLNENEYQTREKNFCIMILKKKQDQLQSFGPMRLFDHECSGKTSTDHPIEPRNIIKRYQLFKSRFVFTLVEKKDGTDEFEFYKPMAVSDIMTEEDDAKPNSSGNRLANTRISEIRCIPRKGDSVGGEEVVIILPNPIKKKKYTIGFDFGGNEIQTVETEIIEPRTILFQTPPCPIQAGEENRRVSILIHENQFPLPSIDFHYILPIQKPMNKRPLIHEEGLTSPTDYKRLRDFNTKDSAECLATKLDQLSLNKVCSSIELTTKHRSNSTSISTISMNERLNNLDKRLGQVKSALENFVRTGDPSELFRAVGFLLSKYEGNSSPLHDAIQNGHTQIALTVIEQTMDLPASKNLLKKENEYGETPLLLAAKGNQWPIIELILKNRPQLAMQTDKQRNNLFHFLANSTEDNGVETIEKIFRILPEQLTIELLNEENQENQTPIQTAQFNGNDCTSKLFHDHQMNSK